METRHTSRGAILKVPEEVLLHIIRLVLIFPDAYWDGNVKPYFRDAVALSKVCRRFSRLAIACMYTHIPLDLGMTRFDHPFPSSREKVMALRNMLIRHSLLREHCRSLLVRVGDHSPDFTIAHEFAAWLTKVQTLHVRGGFEEQTAKDTWGLICAAVKNAALDQMLLVGGGSGNIEPAPIFELVADMACLRVLELHSVNRTEFRPAWRSSYERSSSLTSISLSDWANSPQNLGLLLRFPAALKHFSFTFLHSADRTNRWNASVIASALSPHRSTLKTLNVGVLREAGLDGFDMSCFTSLEDLSISCWTTGKNASEAANLLGPRLRNLRWWFSRENEVYEDYSDFQEPEADWLRALAAAAIARHVPLEHIRIEYSPTDFSVPEEGQYKYPWDFMDTVAAELQRRGISLTYNPPCLSKEEFSNPRDAWGAVGVYLDPWDSPEAGSQVEGTERRQNDSV